MISEHEKEMILLDIEREVAALARQLRSERDDYFKLFIHQMNLELKAALYDRR